MLLADSNVKVGAKIDISWNSGKKYRGVIAVINNVLGESM